MITTLLMLALVLQAPPAASDQNAESEIVVLGHKADRLRVIYHYSALGEMTQCRITRSSGDSDVDRLWCEAARRCAAKLLGDNGKVKACIRPLHHELLKDLVDARTQARARH
jgi:hypothetical protein